MYMPNFLDGFDRLVAFDAETTGKRTPDAEFIRKQPFAWRAPGIIIEVAFVEMLRTQAPSTYASTARKPRSAIDFERDQGAAREISVFGA